MAHHAVVFVSCKVESNMKLSRRSSMPKLMNRSAVGGEIWPAALKTSLKIFWTKTTLPVGHSLGTGEAFYKLLHSLKVKHSLWLR